MTSTHLRGHRFLISPVPRPGLETIKCVSRQDKASYEASGSSTFVWLVPSHVLINTAVYAVARHSDQYRGVFVSGKANEVKKNATILATLNCILAPKWSNQSVLPASLLSAPGVYFLAGNVIIPFLLRIAY